LRSRGFEVGTKVKAENRVVVPARQLAVIISLQVTAM